MRDVSFRVAVLAALSTVVAGVESRADAQTTRPADGEPIIIGESGEWNPFELHQIKAAVDTQARWRTFKRSTVGQQDLTDTEQYLQGRFELSGRAFVGHENLLDINGRIGFGIEDWNVESDTASTARHDRDLLVLYDVSALVLPDGPAPVTVYSRREQTRLDREFSGTIDSLNTEHGAKIRIRSESFPTHIQVFRRDIDQSDQLGFVDYRLKQDSFSVRSTPKIGENHELSIEYILDLVDERQSQFFENSYTRHDAQIIHTVKFGDEKQYDLQSIGRFYDESGTADFRRFRLDEILRLQHTRRFDTRYDLTVEDIVRAGQGQRYFRGAGQARYALFDSLIAVGSLGTDMLDIDGEFTTTQYFADVDLQYIKQVPLGSLDAAFGAGFNRQDNGEQGQPVAFTDQALTLTDPTPTLINRRNIVPSSIVVTSANGLRVYTEGIDYTVAVFPSHVEIERIVGGAILEGESLLVDYTVGPEPASIIDSVNANFAVRYTIEEGVFSGLSGYINYIWIDQNIETIDSSRFILEEVKELYYGLDYRIGHLALQVERRNHDSTIFPFDTTRMEARYNFRLGPTGAFSASVTRDITDFPTTGDQIKLTRATVRARKRFGRELDANLRLIYRDEQSNISDNVSGFEQSLEVTWRRGRTTINASIFNAYLDSGTTDTLSQSFILGVRRTF